MSSQQPSPSCLVFSCPSWAGKLLSTLWFCLPTSSSVCFFFFVLSLCPVGLYLLNQKTLKRGQTILISVSWLGSGVHHVLQWPPGSFCELPHRSHDHCMKCSIFSDSISSQRPVFFFSNSAVKVHEKQTFNLSPFNHFATFYEMDSEYLQKYFN